MSFEFRSKLKSMIRRRPTSNVVCLLSAFFMGLFASTSTATPLPINSTVVPTGIAAPAGSFSIIADTGVVPFTAATFQGTLRSEVIAGDASNPFGGLTFLYQVSNTLGPNDIERMTVNGYVGVLTDASYQIPTTNLAPTFATRDSGDVVGFAFFPGLGGALPPGSTSAWLIVQTNAQSFQPTSAAVIDGSTASPIASFAPGSGIPEPSSLVLAGIGSLAMAFYARRLRRQ